MTSLPERRGSMSRSSRLFAHLHLHSEYSLLDGLGTIQEYVDKAVSLGQKFLGLTDHGNLCGIPEHYWTCRENDVEPVLGMEGYFVPSASFAKESKSQERFHITLLARNEAGYKTLAAINDEAHRNFYYKPLIDRATLEAVENPEDLTVLSGCAASILSDSVLNRSRSRAEEELSWWTGLFPHFYIELMHHDTDFDRKLNMRLLKLAHQHRLPWVVTNDPHYAYKDDCDDHDALLAIQTGSTIDDPDRFSFSGEGYHLKSSREMAKAFYDYQERVWERGRRNSLKIAKESRIRIPAWESRSWHIPTYPDTDDPYRMLKRMCIKELKRRGLNDDERYVDALKHELSEIRKMNVANFMLITWDFLREARERGIKVGPGRGSVCGSLAAWLLDIHLVDPIRYDLLFERFLNPERPKMPDIDSDFEPSRREEMFDYADKRYGAENVVHIATYQKMHVKSAFRVLASAYGISWQDQNRLANLIVEDEDGEDHGFPKEITDNYPDLVDRLEKFLGKPRAFSSHPAGVLIFAPDDPVRELVPQMYLASSKKFVGQFDLKTIERFGLLKEDFLGLRTLETISECVRLIKKNHGVDLDPDSWIPDEEEGDREIYQMLAKGRTNGVFQMEGGTNHRGIQEIKPRRFSDIVACTALYRAGPIIAGAPKRFLENRKHKSVEVIHESLEPILSETWGEMIYQEQMFRILKECAGFNWARVDDAKDAVTKKDADKMASLKKEAVRGFVKVSGMSKSQANEVWEMIASQAKYLFNKSHATAYSILTYQTARLKHLYPLEFFTALLRTVEPKSDANKQKRQSYLSEATMMGYKILTPCVNRSDEFATCTKSGKIRFGLQDIKGVGPSVSKRILSDRPYRHENEIIKAVNNTGAIKALVESGALSCLKIKPKESTLEDRLAWQFHDPLADLRAKLEPKLIRPVRDGSEVRLYGEIRKIETRKTRKDKREFKVWTIQWAPGEEWTITIWEDAMSCWDIMRGSIIRVVGKWSNEWRNVGVGDPSQIKMLRGKRGKAEGEKVNSRS